MWELILSVLAAAVSAFAGSLGMGGGGPLILYLTAYLGTEQRRAQGINLIFFLPTAVIALLLHRKNGLIDGKLSLLCLPFGLLGVAGGIWLSRALTSSLLSKLFAALLVFLAAKDLWSLARDFWQEKKPSGS